MSKTQDENRSAGRGLNGTKKIKKVWYKRMWSYIVGTVILTLTIVLSVQAVRCAVAIKNSKARLLSYEAKTAQLSYGKMTYVDKGAGEVILSIHGIFGGYDQAFDTCSELSESYRIIAPSRFGYLGSDLWGNNTPAEQAAAFVELLDKLGIDKVYALATSAGGSVAIRFALDYPERTKGLILYCSSAPPVEKPVKYAEYAGLPAALCSNYAMFLASPFFEPIMGMAPDTIYSMLPCDQRKDGVVNDSAVTNPDMSRNYDSYKIESLKVPTLIFHAKDDKLSNYTVAANAASRFPNCTFISFETGGHLMTGHSDEIKTVLTGFITENSK